jgi:hypothetical protein
VTSYLEQEPTRIKYEGYQMIDGGLLTYKNKLYIPECDDLKRLIMDELHKIPYVEGKSPCGQVDLLKEIDS